MCQFNLNKYVDTHVCVCACVIYIFMPSHACESQRITCRGSFSPTMWVSGTDPKLTVTAAGSHPFDPLMTHPFGP